MEEFIRYIGTKIVNAKPMTRGDYNIYRGWELPANENPDDKGFLKNDVFGHEQWDPIDSFDRDFIKLNGMSFGYAIEAMKKGFVVARKGWNGKGIHIGIKFPEPDISDMTAPYIYINTTGLKTDNKDAPKSVVPWLASQTDMLANDWTIV